MQSWSACKKGKNGQKQLALQSRCGLLLSRDVHVPDLLGIGIAIAFGDRASPGFRQAVAARRLPGYCAHCKRSWSNKSKNLYRLAACATVSVQCMFNSPCVVRCVAGHRDLIAGRR